MNIIDTIINAFSETLNWSPAEINRHDLLSDREDWDSVNQLRVFMALEVMVSRKLPLKQFVACRTIGAVEELVYSLINVEMS